MKENIKKMSILLMAIVLGTGNVCAQEESDIIMEYSEEAFQEEIVVQEETEISAQETEDFVQETEKGVVLVDFWASWCGPCRMLAPVVEQIAQEHSEWKVCKVNVDEQPELAQQFGVMSIPTVVCLREGKESARSVGLVSKDQLLAKLQLV